MTDLPYTQGQDNLSGLSDALYIVEYDAIDLASLPVMSAVGSLIINANIVLLAGRKFGKIYFTQEEGSLEGKSIGGIDGKGLEFMLKGKYPRLDAAFWVWFRSVQNGPLLVIYQQANTGKKYVLGLVNFDRTTTAVQATLPVYMETLEANTGSKRGDGSGGTLTLKWTCTHGPIEYNGVIDLTP
jgi:hypothetical protein